jgi:hypothetical protein
MSKDKSDDTTKTANSRDTNILEISSLQKGSKQSAMPIDNDPSERAKVLPFAPKKKPLPAFDVEWFYEDEEFFTDWMDEFDM